MTTPTSVAEQIKCDSCVFMSTDCTTCSKGLNAWAEPNCAEYAEYKGTTSPIKTPAGKPKLKAYKWKDEDIEFYVHK